jgi:hypothetical protein
LGHEERFPPTRLNAGCGFRKVTIAGMRRNGRDEPKAVAVRTSKFRSWRKPESRLSREMHQRWGFSQVLDDADWVN